MVKKSTKKHPTAKVDDDRRRLTTSVSLSEVMEAGTRLEASAFDAEARESVANIKSYCDGYQPLFGAGGLGVECSLPNRLKRIYVSPDYGLPFLSSSDILSLYPKAKNYLSRKLTSNSDGMLVKQWDILISRSGTIGNIGLAGKRMEGMALSEHALRLSAPDKNTSGFIAAFLRSKYGKLQLTKATYGSVIIHIEPEHLKTIYIPKAHPVIRSEIGSLFVQACEARDKANELLDEADQILHNKLGLPPLNSLKVDKHGFGNSIKASRLQGRLEAGFHDYVAEKAEAYLRNQAHGVLHLGDTSLTTEVRAVTKFRKRVYVPHNGIRLLSSKQIFQIDPIDVKELGRGRHIKDMKEIGLKENMVAVTCSGTIGRVQIIPKYMEGWAANQHAIRLVATNNVNAGYIYAWLSSDYGQKLIRRHSYGSVILEIDRFMMATILVPNASQIIREEIARKVLKANALRNTAWEKEQKSIARIEELITG